MARPVAVRDWSRVRDGLDVRITSISVQSDSLGRLEQVWRGLSRSATE